MGLVNTIYVNTKWCTSTQNVSGKIISLSCCFQLVTHIFVGSFLHGIGPGLLVSTSSSFHVFYSPCHLSTVDWLTPACSQLLTPMFSTHLLNFQTSISLSSHATGQVWEAPAVNSLKVISSLLCFKSQSVMPIGVFTADVLQAWPVTTVKLVFLHLSGRKFHLYCFHLYETFCFMYVLLLHELLWQRL